MSDHKTIAETLADELEMTRIAQYTIVDDGADRWIAETAHIDAALAYVINHYLTADTSGQDDDDIRRRAYDLFCREAGCLYSRIGSPSDELALAEGLDCTEADAVDISGALRIADTDAFLVAFFLAAPVAE